MVVTVNGHPEERRARRITWARVAPINGVENHNGMALWRDDDG
jgi:hypothetical protein